MDHRSAHFLDEVLEEQNQKHPQLVEFENQIKDRVNEFAGRKELILELSRVSYYKTELINKLWHIENDHSAEEQEETAAVKEQDGKTV